MQIQPAEHKRLLSEKEATKDKEALLLMLKTADERRIKFKQEVARESGYLLLFIKSTKDKWIHISQARGHKRSSITSTRDGFKAEGEPHDLGQSTKACRGATREGKLEVYMKAETLKHVRMLWRRGSDVSSSVNGNGSRIAGSEEHRSGASFREICNIGLRIYSFKYHGISRGIVT